MKSAVSFCFSIFICTFAFSTLSLSARADDLGSFRYECVDAGGEAYDLFDSLNLPNLRAETEAGVHLVCEQAPAAGEEFRNLIQPVSTHAAKKAHSRARHHVQRHCLSAGQACWGVSCETECCHSPAGITSLFWYSCE